MSETLAALKVRNQARLGEEKRQIEKRRTLLVLILSHLAENGYHETVERLQKESGTSLSRHSVADNVDLASILHDYEAYYEFRFGKKPKLTRRSESSGGGRSTAEKQRQLQAKRTEQRERRNRRQNYSGHIDHGDGGANVDWRNSTALRGKSSEGGIGPSAGSTGRRAGAGTAAAAAAAAVSAAAAGSGPGTATAQVGGSAAAAAAAAAPGTTALDLGVEGRKVEHAKSRQDSAVRDAAWHQERLLKPLGQFGVDSETRDLARIISRDIYQHNPGVQWDDIVELHEAKRLLKEVCCVV